MISGFLLYSEKGIGRDLLKRNIKYIWHIILWTSLLFLFVKEVMFIAKGDIFVPTNRQWLYFVVFNENPFGFHLWYLGAYLYVLLIMMCVDKYNLWRPLLWLTPILLLCDLILGKYSFLLLNREFPFIYVRNFLFVGVPYFMIGVWIKQNINKLITVNRLVYGAGIVFFSITSVMEKEFILHFVEKNPAREHFLSTTFLAICLFLFILSFRNLKASILSKIGETDSLYIYIFHPLFLIAMPSLMKHLPVSINDLYMWIAPFLIFILTTVFVLILRKIKVIK